MARYTRSAIQAVGVGRSQGQSTPMLSDDIAEVLRSHRPRPPATAAELEAFERRTGITLDLEFRTFYGACNGAELFPGTGDPYRFVPLSEIARFGIATKRPPRPDDVYGFLEFQDAPG